MTSQTCNNDVLFSLQISKQPHRIKCSDQFRVSKGKNKIRGQRKRLSCLNFLINLRFFMDFTEGRGGTLKEWDRDVDVLKLLKSDLWR